MDTVEYKNLLKKLFTKLTKVVFPHKNIRSHGIKHWLEVANSAGQLALLADEPHDIIHASIVAGLIHDIGRIDDSNRIDPDHGNRSVSIAKKENLLRLLKVNKDLWQDVYDAVSNHTFGIKTDQIIAKYLWDADRLCLMNFNMQSIDPKRMSSSVWKRLCK